MKKLVVLFFCGLLAVFGCTKDSPQNEADAEITGFDMRLCACCGGWWIRVGNDTARAATLPDNFGDNIDAADLPMAVKIVYDTNGVITCTTDKMINVRKIRKR